MMNDRAQPWIRRSLAVFTAAGLLASLPGRPAARVVPVRIAAHEIPASVTVIAFLKPDGQRLRVVVRVPLESIRDVQFPLVGPGYLDLPALQPLLADAARLWIADYLEIVEGSQRLDIVEIAATRISLPSDRSFDAYDEALAHVRGSPLPAGTELPWQQAMLDVLLEYPITSAQSKFSIWPALSHLGIRTFTVLHFIEADGTDRTFQYLGDPGLVRLDPRWYQASLQFIKLGFSHILDGIDHLLFVLCLVIPFRKFRPLVAIVTSFTVAHSITLIASAAGMAPNALWFPPLIEMLIALSIVYMAFENIVGAKLERRWLIAFAFGLVHGFGFSFVLRDTLQFAGSHVPASLLAFNVGVELGQIFVLILAIPMLEWLLRKVVAERVGTILLSALVAHTAWHWMLERAASLRAYDFQWPALDLAFLATMMRALLLLLLIAGAVYLLYGWAGRWALGKPRGETSQAGS